MQRLFKRYINGTASPREKDLVERWYEEADNFSDPDWFTPDLAEEKKEIAWNDLASRFNLISQANIHAREKRSPFRNYALLTIRYAAVITVMAAMGWLIYKSVKVPLETPGTVTAYTYYATGPRQLKTLTLPDGSVVRLNNNSQLSLKLTEFNVIKREVWLGDGEAFFQVKKDPQKPFIVYTHSFVTRVLGTSFNVWSDSARQVSEVTVVTGKVHVSATALPSAGVADLTPGEQARLLKDNIRIYKVDTVLYTSWKDGLLVFKNAPFQEVKQRLERWYGVNIVVHNSAVYQRRTTASFSHKNLDHVLSSLGVAAKFRFVIENDTVIIK